MEHWKPNVYFKLPKLKMCVEGVNVEGKVVGKLKHVLLRQRSTIIINILLRFIDYG